MSSVSRSNWSPTGFKTVSFNRFIIGVFLSELAGEVLFGPFVFRCGEQGLRAAGFDQLAEVHKQRVVRDPRRLRQCQARDRCGNERR